MAGFTRRDLLRGKRPARPLVARPPWAVAEARFVDACTRCGRCAGACPEGIVVAGGGGFPVIDFRRGGCTFCAACAEACPEPAFDDDARAAAAAGAWRHRARISAACLADAGIECRSCADWCDARALRVAPATRPARPAVDLQACTGCGACVAPCPVGAIEMSAMEVPEHA